MNVQAILGQLLLWGGFLSGALAAVFRIKSIPNEWDTIPWHWFLWSLAAGIVGIVLFRTSRRGNASDEDIADADFALLAPALERLRQTIAQLLAELPQLAPSEIVKRIDDQCAEDFAEFVESRESIIRQQGLPAYANVMTEFAAAERAVNRAWSAAADGYLDEVATCLERARRLIVDAQEQLGGKATR